ncbi:hypothetical protein MKX08_006259 [Trichoderma sp. CBMAI-0020]|nr:hypothetical protein MKX08_006259 [Trichoderma sp. CBMAI-0020]
MTEAMRMNPLPAPHPVLPAAAFPRVYADDFPHGDREAYAKYYPYGLPVTYKMIHGVHSQGVAQTYLEDNLPIGFYANIPPKAPAIISTLNGSRPFRNLDQIQPQRRIHLWTKDEIQAICNSLRKLHWDELKNMQQPYCWDDLWTYFDAYDLYHNGCLNLWNVINTIWDENKLISIDVKREVAAHIGHWADEWLKLKENRKKLTQWKESQGSIYRILNDKDHESLGSLQDDVVPLIASALKSRRAYLLSNMEAERAEGPADLVTAFRTNSVENWLTGQPVFDGCGLPPPPVSEPHRMSDNPAPCFEQNGKHYYLPPNCFSPPESVQKSTDNVQALHNPPDVVSSPATFSKSGVVIVNGSNAPKVSQGPINKAYQKKSDEIQSQNDTRRTSSMPETSSPMIPGDGLELGRRRPQLVVDNENSTSADVRRSSESAALSTTEQELSDTSLCLKKWGPDANLGNPMKEIADKKQAGQDATHMSRSDDDTAEDLRAKSLMGVLLASSLKSSTMPHSKKAIQTNLGDAALHRTGPGKALGVAILLAQAWSTATAPATSVTNATEVFGFGKVEEAFPAASMKRDAFIVRFESEPSVPQALAFGGGVFPEKEVRITIQPAHRSKWMKPRHPQQQQPRKLPPLPITHQQPPRHEPFSTSENHAHVQVPPRCSLALSRTSTSEPDQHEISSRPTSTSTLPQAGSSSQRMEKQSISPIVEPKWDEKPVKLPASTGITATNREHFALEEPREHAASATLFPLQAMDYPKVENFDKESVPCSEPLPEETVIEKSIECDITTLDRDSSKCSSPKMLDIALPNTPINSTCSSSDTPKAIFCNDSSPTTGTGSPMSKNNNRKVKSLSPVVVEDRQHQTLSVIGEIENAARVHQEGDNETTTSSDLRMTQNPIQSIGRASITTVASLEKHVESSTNGSAQISSYTEKEIKERKQAWNRIPMPLDLRKSKKLGTTVASSQQLSLPILNEPSNNTTEKADTATMHIRKRDQLKAIDSLGSVKAEQSAKPEELAKDETQYLTKDESLDSDPKSAQRPIVSPESGVSTKMMTKEETQSSKTKIAGPHQTESEETDATASNSQAPTDENKTSDVADSQIKQKIKWNKPKKSKKRPTLTPLTVLQNEGSSQDVSPSVSETPIVPKEELRTDSHTLTSAPAVSESASRPVHSVERPEERATEFFKGPVVQATTNARSQYSYDTLPRGRHEFRSSAGGSLKVPKKRKNKYPAITSKTFEASSTSRFEPPQPEHAVSGQMPMRSTDNSIRPDSVTHITEADSSKKSRLNPLAMAFESPQKASVAAVDTVKAPHLYKAGSLRMRGEEELPRENQSPSKFKIMQRTMAAQDSPTKSQQPKEKLVRRIDSSKAVGSFETSSRQQENNPAEIQRSWSKDKHRNEGESKEPVISKATSPGKKAALDKEDWPSLPASRVRSATLQ